MILALETSGKSGSAALMFPDGRVVSQATSPELGSAQTLPVLVREMLSNEQIAVASLKAIAVTVGPGSFTGLRVGVSIAKTLAYGLGIPTIAVDTLEALAVQVCRLVPHPHAELWTLLDAYRGELFAAEWGLERESVPGEIAIKKNAHLVNCEAFSQRFREEGSDSFRPKSAMGITENDNTQLVLAGPGLSRLNELKLFFETNKADVIWVPEVKPDAKEVALIAARKFCEGDVTDPMRLMPVYLRSSAAEEKVRPRPAS
jgi:tRNA threonylcarbamoyladenosine biosynthesis protein TsaB